MNQEGRRILWIAAVVVLLFVILAGYSTHIASLSAKVMVTAAPQKSSITFNGKRGKDGTNRVKPGDYTVKVSMDGFSPVSQKVSVKKGDNKTVDVVLSPNTAATANWYSRHPADAKIAGGISSRNNDKLAKQSVQNAPLIQLLPFVGGGMEFRVDYGNLPGAQAGQPVIYITASTPDGQQAGLSWIKSIGFDPSNYNIKFVTGEVQPLN